DPGRSSHRGRYALRGRAALVDQPRPSADHRAADAGPGAAGPGRTGAGTGATGTPRPAGTGCGRPDRGQPDPRPRAGRGADSGHPPGLLPRPDRSDAAVPVRTRPTRTAAAGARGGVGCPRARSEEHTSELQSRFDLVCRLLLEKKNITEMATLLL